MGMSIQDGVLVVSKHHDELILSLNRLHQGEDMSTCTYESIHVMSSASWNDNPAGFGAQSLVELEPTSVMSDVCNSPLCTTSTVENRKQR